MTENIWLPGVYTAKQIGKLNELVTRLRHTGNASRAQRIELAMSKETPYSDIIVDDEAPVRGTAYIRPETKADLALVDIPPMHGAGSSTDAWREFASIVMEIEPEILENLGRDEIVQLLIARDIIDGEIDDE